MELETLFNLPAHPLLVHIPVVLVPLAALIAIVFAFRPAWLDRFGWALVALSGVGAVGAILAAGSGEGLESILRRNGEEIGQALQDHAELGEIARNIAVLFFLVVLAVVVLRRMSLSRTGGVWSFIKSKGGAITVAAVLTVSAGAAMVTISQAGHQGAKVTWNDAVNGG